MKIDLEKGRMCSDCNYWSNTGQHDKCPDCKSDEWVELGIIEEYEDTEEESSVIYCECCEFELGENIEECEECWEARKGGYCL